MGGEEGEGEGEGEGGREGEGEGEGGRDFKTQLKSAILAEKYSTLLYLIWHQSQLA